VTAAAAQLEALSVDTRRAVFTLLLDGPRSVAQLAAELPVSRPAVSQHLRVLLDAGLVQVSEQGTRRVYAADPAGVTVLRDWAEQLWNQAMAGFATLAENQTEERDE
jgi:DNA-binding transcriptional ArsR family regulator